MMLNFNYKKHRLALYVASFFQKHFFLFSFLFGYLITCLAVFHIGFQDLVLSLDYGLDRYRDITFKVWENNSLAEHGFLVFLNEEDFGNRVAYSNQSYTYVFLLWIFYKLENLHPFLDMRLVSAYFNISVVALALYLIASKLKTIDFKHSSLLILLIVFTISVPAFWVSAAKFNLDNPYPLVFLLTVHFSLGISEPEITNESSLFPGLMLSLFHPISGAVLGTALVLYLFFYGVKSSFSRKMFVYGCLTVFFSLLIYCLPLFISSVLGYESSNSSWMFRSGLDGDRTYFSNVYQAIFEPLFPRPQSIILLPVGLAFLSGIEMIFLSFRRFDFTGCFKSAFQNPAFNVFLFLYLISAQYIFTCLLWPQAVSIHPYLFDIFLVFPALCFAMLTFACKKSGLLLLFWFYVLSFSILHNFQILAQSAQTAFYYPGVG